MSKDNVVPINTKKKKKYLPLLYIVFSLAIIGIFLYQVFKINYNPVTTEIALDKTVANNVITQAFIVRDETPIIANVSGTLVPLVEDGKRVANGDDVAVVFADETAAKIYNQLTEVKNDIAYFSSLQNKIGIQTSDFSALDERLYNACENYVSTIAGGVVESYSEKENLVRDAATSRQLSSGVEIDPSQKLSELKLKLSELEGQERGYTKIKADNPGYYISVVDGYEKAVDYSKVSSMTTEQIENLLNGNVSAVTADSGNYMGKLVDGFNWYIFCVLDYEKVMGIQMNGKLTVEFLGTTAEPIKAEVVAINDAVGGKTALVLKCNLMNTKYAVLRNEQIRLVFNEYTGFQVNNKAIRELDGQKGVYVLNGNIITFKKINIVYSDSEYSVCTTPDGESGYIKLYDEIVVEGTDLYDGKILG